MQFVHPGLKRMVLSTAVPGCARLVGHSPQLTITDAGQTPDPGPRNPATLRSKVMLTADDCNDATVSQVSFLVDKGLISVLKPGDLLYLARTDCGRIGFSAIRNDLLIFAVGAITAVPLGRDFSAEIPIDLIRDAQRVFRKRDPRFELSDYPIEVRAGNERHILLGGRRKVSKFDLWVLHGHLVGIPGTNECVSVVRTDMCPAVGANSSALFLDTDRFHIVRWPVATPAKITQPPESQS